ANRSAMPRPIPCEDPVTSATLSLSLIACLLWGAVSGAGRLQQAEMLVDLALVGVGPAAQHLVERDRAPEPPRLERSVGQRQRGPPLLAGHLDRPLAERGLAELVELEREDARVGVV